MSVASNSSASIRHDTLLSGLALVVERIFMGTARDMGLFTLRSFAYVRDTLWTLHDLSLSSNFACQNPR